MTEESLSSAESSVRVLIVDAHALVRKGIRALLSEAGGFEVEYDEWQVFERAVDKFRH